MKNLGILIGRFQPFHLGHDSLLQEALKQCDEVILIIGSSNRARSIKNPWTFEERCTMIREAYPDIRLHFAAIPDYFYNEKAWFEAVQHAIDPIFPQFHKMLFGHSKDESSYYLQKFKTWELRECPDYAQINATEIRKTFFINQKIHAPLLSSIVAHWLQNFMNTSAYLTLKEEAHYIDAYRKSWSHAPYPPIFSTVDALVVCDHKVLLIERARAPGKGLLALPGGFLEPHEWIHDGILRELKEETCIARSDVELKKALREIKTYDYPGRSNIGRVITHAGLFLLDGQVCPEVHAADDALRANWYPLSDLSTIQDQLHDDHYQLIADFLSKHGLLKWE